MMGEEEVLREIKPADQFRTQMLAIRKIVGQSAAMQTDLAPFLSEAEALAAEWLREDQ